MARFDDLEAVRERFDQDPFARLLGIVLDELSVDGIRMHMPLRADMHNLFGRIHGGAIYALADAAFSVLANNGNNIAVALDCSITYHASPETDAVLYVRGETLSVTRRTASYLFKVYMQNGADPVPVATMKSVAYRTGKPVAKQ